MHRVTAYFVFPFVFTCNSSIKLIIDVNQRGPVLALSFKLLTSVNRDLFLWCGSPPRNLKIRWKWHSIGATIKHQWVTEASCICSYLYLFVVASLWDTLIRRDLRHTISILGPLIRIKTATLEEQKQIMLSEHRPKWPHMNGKRKRNRLKRGAPHIYLHVTQTWKHYSLLVEPVNNGKAFGRVSV